MSAHCKVYRFRMEPNREQGHALNRMAGARRWVWNWGLNRRREHYRSFGKTLTFKALCIELTALKTRDETAWLKEADSQALQQVLKDLCQAFVNFFEKRARFPRFKSKKRDPGRFRIPQRVKITDCKVYVPKVGNVRIRQSQDIDGSSRSATFKRDARGHWFVTLTVEFDMPDVALPAPDLARVAGIDLGLIDFATFTDARPVPAPRFFRKGRKELRRAQRAVSRRQDGSKRKAKARAKVARIHQKVGNQRKDFLHQLTTRLVRDHDGLCIEDLSLRGLARTKLAKSFTDASMGEFRRQLAYKSEWNQRHLVVIGRFFPSSKMCSACGAINHELMLSDREWDCVCAAHHHRDPNAATNIRDEGLRILAAGRAESQNAQGQPVRPAKVGKAG